MTSLSDSNDSPNGESNDVGLQTLDDSPNGESNINSMNTCSISFNLSSRPERADKNGPNLTEINKSVGAYRILAFLAPKSCFRTRRVTRGLGAPASQVLRMALSDFD